MHIRKARKQDFPEIIELHLYLVKHLCECRPERYQFIPEESDYFQEKLSKSLEGANGAVFVAEENGGVVGYGWGTIKSYPPMVRGDVYGELKEVVVALDYQGKGLGRKLAEALLGFFEKRGVKHFELVVDSENKKALSVWQKLGFKEQLMTFRKNAD